MSMIQKQTLLKGIKEPLFAKEILGKVPVKTFDAEPEYAEIALALNRYYQTNNTPLDENTFLTLLEDRLNNKKATPETVSNHMRAVANIYEISKSETGEVVDEQIDRFIKKTLSSDLIMQTLSKNQLSDDGVIEQLSDGLKRIAVMSSNAIDGSFIDFFNDVDRKKAMYKNMKESRYSTGFASIDRLSGGGLARGELGLVIAQSGHGKSTIATQLATNYSKKSMNVLYVVLEEKLDRMVMKIEQNMLGISRGVLIDEDDNLREDIFDEIQDMYKKTPNLGNFFISKHSPQEVTLTKLEQIILDATIRKGVHVDAVIIDYPDLMKSEYSSNVSESDAGGKLYEGVRALAQKYDYVCWVLSQLNRGAFSQEVKTAEFIEGSKKKINAVELAFTINQTKEERKHGFLRLHVDKVRYQDGKVYDPIQVYKVEPEGYVVRDATVDEINQNINILKEAGNEGRPENQYDKVMENVTKINTKI